jgi:hypothetical protein
MARWWPRKWSVRHPRKDGSHDHLFGHEYAWWQLRKRRQWLGNVNVAGRFVRFDWRLGSLSVAHPIAGEPIHQAT